MSPDWEWPLERSPVPRIPSVLTTRFWRSGILSVRAALGSKPTAIAVFVALGCVFRIIRYAQNLPLWSDECFLSVNFIDRGYRELLEPLDNG